MQINNPWLWHKPNLCFCNQCGLRRFCLRLHAPYDGSESQTICRWWCEQCWGEEMRYWTKIRAESTMQQPQPVPHPPTAWMGLAWTVAALVVLALTVWLSR